jgi:membrane protein DedA with SNARE-associated domain
MTVFAGSMLPPPFPFTSVLMAAGALQYPHKRFLLALTAGRVLRFFSVAYLSGVYGRRMIDFFSRRYQTMPYALIALAVTAGIGALVYFKWRRSTARNKSNPRRPIERT